MSQITISELSPKSYINELASEEVATVLGGVLPFANGSIGTILENLGEPPDDMFSALIFYGQGTGNDGPVPTLTTNWVFGSGDGGSLGTLGFFV